MEGYVCIMPLYSIHDKHNFSIFFSTTREKDLSIGMVLAGLWVRKLVMILVPVQAQRMMLWWVRRVMVCLVLSIAKLQFLVDLSRGVWMSTIVSSMDKEGGETMMEIAKRRMSTRSIVNTTIACLMIKWVMVVSLSSLLLSSSLCLSEFWCKYVMLFCLKHEINIQY